jgi:WD40 repeat protein
VIGYGDGLVSFDPLTGGRMPIGDLETTSATPALAFSHDGAVLAALHQDGIMLWSNDPLWAPGVEGNGIHNARLLRASPTADRLFVIAAPAANDTRPNIQVWRADPPGNRATPVGQFHAGVDDVGFAADGKSLLVLSGNTLTTAGFDGKTIRQLDLPPLEGPVLSPDGTLVAGRSGGQLAVHRVADGSLLWQAALALPGAPRLLFVKPALGVAELGPDRVVVHDMSGGKGRPLFPLAHPLTFAESSPDGATLAGINDRGELIRLRLSDGAALSGPSVARPPGDELYALAVSSDGRYLAASGMLTSVWDLAGRFLARTTGGAMQLDFSPTGDRLAVSFVTCEWDRLSDGSRISPALNRCTANAVFHPGGDLVAGATERLVAIYRAEDGGDIQTFDPRVRFPGMRFSPDGTVLVTSGHQAWRTKDWKLLWQQDPDIFRADSLDLENSNSVAFTPDGSQVLISSSEREYGVTPSLWRTHSRLRATADGKLIREFKDKDALDRRPSFSPAGDWITAGPTVHHLASPTTRALDPDTRVSLFLPDGRIAGGKIDGTITLYCPSP